MSKPVLNLDLYKNYKSDFPPDAFHHVAWKTMQYEKMVDFYTKLFGCEALYESDQITFWLLIKNTTELPLQILRLFWRELDSFQD